VEAITMHITSIDRIIAGLAAAYLGYRLWSGWSVGIHYGDGDMEVHADQHPTAFVLTVLSSLLLIAILAYLALAPDGIGLSAAAVWLKKHWM
jgi:hypothetical protein